MNYYGISNLLAGITSLTMALFVLAKGHRHRLTKIWSFFSFSVAIYGFGAYMATLAKSASEGFFWWQISYVGVILIPLLFVIFIYEFLGIQDKKFIYFIGCCTLVFLISDVFLGKLFIGNSTLLFKNISWAKPAYWVYPPGPLHIFFTIFAYFGWVIYAHIQLIKSYKNTTGIKRSQIKYFFLATALGFAGGGTSFLPCFGIHIYPIFNFTVFLYPIIMTYAIFRYRLMDITIALTRTSIFVATYTIILGLPFGVAVWLKTWLVETFSSQWWIMPLGLMAALATVGPFIYIYIDRKAEAALLKEQRRYQDTLKQASIGMTRIRDLKKLLTLITHIVTKTVRIVYAAVYLYDKNSNEYTLQIRRDKDTYSIPRVSANLPLLEWIREEREPLIYEEVKRKAEEGNLTYIQLEENMRLLSATVIIPSFLETRLMGFFVLGDKITGEVYTPDDLNVFHVLATQAALAIENAQFYEEAQEMHEQIAQAEKMATIGTMADGLSHQINNRFYALSLIAGDSIDNLKTTDTSKCSREVKEMLNEVNHALERIQANVNQGGEVVRGLLKYSRKGDEGFEAIDLNEVIDNTLEMVQYKVRLSEIDIVRDFPDPALKIKGNMTQLEEVFFNFIDNANDAIHERKDMLKEPEYRGRISISARPSGDHSVEIVFEDNGMGVKDGDGNKMFTPFFTTKTSARKGTGLGLYVIKRIITDMHKGSIDFQSEHKKGTRFVLSLPLAR